MRLTLFCTSLLVLFLSVSSAHAGTISKPPYSLSLNSGLVGHWTFDGAHITNGRINDISGQGNHGNTSGIATSTFYTVGKLGQAGNFDGVDDYVNVSEQNSSMAIGSTATISGWIKLQVSPSGDMSILRKTGGSGEDKSISLNAARRLSCYLAGAFDAVLVSNTALSVGAWNHFTCVYDGTNASIYINGSLDNSVLESGDVTDAGNALRIGRSPAPDTYFYTGTLDDVRIYSRALSVTEIAQLYSFGASKLSVTKTPANLKSGLTAHWTFDGSNITNGRINDISGQGNHGNTVNISTSTFYAMGKIGQGGNFDGVNDSVTSPYLLPSSNAYSLSLWFKATSLNSSAKVIFCQNPSGVRNCLHYAPSLNQFAYNNDSNLTDTSGGASYVMDQNWHHLVIVEPYTGDSDNAVMYIDGVALPNATGQNLSPSSSNVLFIGNRVDGDLGWLGILDDVRVYNRALTASEIRQLYATNVSKQNVTLAPTGLKSGLVGHWTFDGKNMTNGRVDDISGQGNHGNILNIATSTFYAMGKMGQGANFDGVDDYITIADTVALRPGTSAWTISTWINPININQYGGLVAKRDGGSFVQMMLVAGDYGSGCNSAASKKLALIQFDGTNGGCMETNTDIIDGNWHHVAMVKNSNGNMDFTLYVDGVSVALTTVTTFGTGSANMNNTVPWLIGCQNASTSCVNGKQDDVRIYSRALSASEIIQLYNSGR
jgi:hypothetical protein